MARARPVTLTAHNRASGSEQTLKQRQRTIQVHEEQQDLRTQLDNGHVDEEAHQRVRLSMVKVESVKSVKPSEAPPGFGLRREATAPRRFVVGSVND